MRRFMSAFFLLWCGAAFAAETRESLDLNKDGQKETVRISENGTLQREETDDNGDGKVDRTLYYRRGFRYLRETDADHDGRIDKWELYNSKGIKQIIRRDTNGDGKHDRSNFLLQSTAIVLREYDKNFDGKVDRRDVSRFDYDKTTKMHRYLYDWKEEDADFDGKIDVYRVRGEKQPKPDKTGQAIDAAFREVEEPEAPKPSSAPNATDRLLTERSGFEKLVADSQDALGRKGQEKK